MAITYSPAAAPRRQRPDRHPVPVPVPVAARAHVAGPEVLEVLEVPEVLEVRDVTDVAEFAVGTHGDGSVVRPAARECARLSCEDPLRTPVDLRFRCPRTFLPRGCDTFARGGAVMSEPTGHRPSHGAGVPPVPTAPCMLARAGHVPPVPPAPPPPPLHPPSLSKTRAAVHFYAWRDAGHTKWLRLSPTSRTSPVDDDLVPGTDLREQRRDLHLVPYVDAAVRAARVAAGREVVRVVHGLAAAEEHRVRHG